MTTIHYDNITEANTSFRPIAGFPNYYITNQGNVYKTIAKGKKMRAIKSYTGGGNSTNSPNGKYEVVALTVDGKPHRKYVHQLVLNAFVGLRPFPDYHACHYDGNRQNNYLSNLRWDTAKANAADKKRQKRGW